MFKKAIFTGLVAIALLGSVTQARADQVTIFLDHTGNYLLTGTVTGAGGSASGFIVCVDISRQGLFGTPYPANASTFTDLSGTKFGEIAREKYIQAAWLFDQMVADPSDQHDLQFAIWSLFNTSVQKGAAVEEWLKKAAKQVLSFDVSGFLILTPLDGSLMGPQEMITRIKPPAPAPSPTATPPPTTNIPEPATLLLVASGFGLAALRGRKRVGVPKE